jgi:hypothetical protein
VTRWHANNVSEDTDDGGKTGIDDFGFLSHIGERL